LASQVKGGEADCEIIIPQVDHLSTPENPLKPLENRVHSCCRLISDAERCRSYKIEHENGSS